MRDPFVFDSRSEFCKKPYGAVPCGSDVDVSCPSPHPDGYSRCVLVARREFSGEEIQMELLPEAVDGERTRFTGVLTAPSEPELLWYHFRLNPLRWLYGPVGSIRLAGDRGDPKLAAHRLRENGHPSVVWRWCGLSDLPGPLLPSFPPGPYRSGGKPLGPENWNDQPVWAPDPDGEVRNRDFFGGSLNGIIAKRMIWPLWASPCCT